MRTALVTGANRGLGFETSRQLAVRGLKVIMTARDREDGLFAVRSLTSDGLGAEYRPLDVTSDRSRTALREGLRRDGVTIDVLVNNAGIALHGFDAKVARETLDVNFFGPMHVTDALLPHIADGGSVVMVSSGLGELVGLSPSVRESLGASDLTRSELVACMQSFIGDVEAGRHEEAGWPSSAYAVSKAGLNALTRVLARDLSARRIRVNAVCPGWVRTDMGTEDATRSVEEGASSVVWAAAPAEGPTGGFFRDGEPVPW
jgi:carbonyl reductase 1